MIDCFVVVEGVDDPIILGIYEQLAENTTEPTVDTFITFGSVTLLIRQEWIDLKNEILAEREDKHHKTIFLKGTAGRGKSSFVYYLMYCILMRAKESRKRKSEEEFLIGYVNNAGNEKIMSLLSVSRAIKVGAVPRSVYYYIADIKGDENRTNLALCFTMVVASDEEGKTEFRKRVKEAGKDKQSGYTYFMVSPTRNQMHLMFQECLSHEEIEFRLDIVGCNPRELGNGVETCKIDNGFVRLVTETYEELFGLIETDEDRSRLEWVMCVIMQSIETAKAGGDNRVTMTSLFREDVMDAENKRWIVSVYTSTFMCFLAGKIRDQHKK